MTMRLLMLGVSVAILAVGCNPEIGQYVPRKREYTSPVKFPQEMETPTAGSLWTPGQVGNFLFENNKAQRVGDLVTIRIEETTDASLESSTSTGRDSSMSNTFTDVLAMLKYLQPELSGAELLGGLSKSKFEGSGMTASKENVTAKVTVIVKAVLPNGTMFVEGWKALQLNKEQKQLYISGVLRTEDIDDDNSVSSTRLAEAEIGIGGVGVISEVQSPGVLTRIMNKYNPF